MRPSPASCANATPMQSIRVLHIVFVRHDGHIVEESKNQRS